MSDRQLIIDAWSYRGPFWARGFYKLAFPSIASLLRKNYCRSHKYVQESRMKFFAALDETDRILTNQPYLLGGEPTRPDLAVAALLAPLVRPQEYVMAWLQYPPALENFVNQQKLRPTWRFVERMYRNHRSSK